MNTGERIKELRTEHGYLQSDLADKVGCTKQIISNIERSCSRPALDLTQKIADVFRVDVKCLMQPDCSVTPVLTDEEIELIKDIRIIHPDTRDLVMKMVKTLSKK